jgi:hypothetical protein
MADDPREGDFGVCTNLAKRGKELVAQIADFPNATWRQGSSPA